MFPNYCLLFSSLPPFFFYWNPILWESHASLGHICTNQHYSAYHLFSIVLIKSLICQKEVSSTCASRAYPQTSLVEFSSIAISQEHLYSNAYHEHQAVGSFPTPLPVFPFCESYLFHFQNAFPSTFSHRMALPIFK